MTRLSPVATVAVSRLDLACSLSPTIHCQRTANIVTFLELATRVATHKALGFACIDAFAFSGATFV